MQFWVNGEQTDVKAGPACGTLLNYLRDSGASMGTKEGCASGDCGACTVLVADAEGGYQSVNSCLVPLASVQGRQVLTVEGLAQGDQLHPVQQALVDCHGSQCGFCTPGFVMSLASLHQTSATPPAHAEVIDAISGNLCRCTGYKPIVEAGLQALAAPGPLPPAPAPMTGSPQPLPGYWAPTSETELRALLEAHPDAQIVAGGTDLMLAVTQQYQTFSGLIDVSGIASLTRIDSAGDTLCIGAAASYSAQERALGDLAPAYVAMLKRLGSRQIRNRGTLGGNICNASPIADTPPWLLVQEAELIIGKPEGGFRYERLEDFYQGYKQTTLAAGEYLADVRLSRARLACPAQLYKVSKRCEDDISAVSGAFLINPGGQLRIAYGGMAAVPKRARATEAFINAQAWRNDQQWSQVVDQALAYLQQDFAPMTDVRASADYRMAMAHSMLRKACRAFVSGEAEVSVYA